MIETQRLFQPSPAFGFVVILVCALFSSCSLSAPAPPRVATSQLSPYPNAAKAPDCMMPVLQDRPTQRYREVAIVEGWADTGDGESLLAAIRRDACQTGADALVVLEDKSQITKAHLYRATPNEASEEASGQQAQRPGYYIQKEEHMPKIGERGHTGCYIDTVAIVYDHQGR
jgi:hypothetical protein